MNTIREIFEKYQYTSHSLEGMIDYSKFEDAIADYEASKWVSVDERLPELDQPVIGYGFCDGEINGLCRDRSINCGIWKGSHIECEGDAYFVRLIGISHWQALPQSPEIPKP